MKNQNNIEKKKYICNLTFLIKYNELISDCYNIRDGILTNKTESPINYLIKLYL